MKQEKKSHRVNSREHLKELTQGKFKYFTLEFDGHTIQRDGMTQLVSESYRIPNKVKEELAEEAKQYGKWQDNRFVIVNYDILDDFYTLSSVRSDSAVKELVENNPMLKYIYNKKSCIIMDYIY